MKDSNPPKTDLRCCKYRKITSTSSLYYSSVCSHSKYPPSPPIQKVLNPFVNVSSLILICQEFGIKLKLQHYSIFPFLSLLLYFLSTVYLPYLHTYINQVPFYMDATLSIYQVFHPKPFIAYMVITRSPSPQNNDNLPLPFFCGNYSIFLLNNIY